MKTLTLLLYIFCGLLNHICFAESNIYSHFNSLESVIYHESEQIQQFHYQNSEKLSDAYASRGESYLISQQYDKALEDFGNAYFYAANAGDLNNVEASKFRALLGEAISHGILGNDTEFHISKNLLNQILQSQQCQPCQSATLIIPCGNDTPIFGPEHMSIGECIQAVENTARAARNLIAFVSKPEIQICLNMIIDRLENDARRCCKSGGVWKGCIQKLANKFHTWNQKWKVFGIPPDPAWD